ncbi:MAG: 4-hydroxy-tetrahydrodipicolinate reductase [Dehalococcoidales bacterium]|jgi:4-hydroxy-tetrahydrodipicolinate reductase|nr:4-hydroxy-tetrahydrodipicolinate reductase [Dehalococcoidales bacterium]
MEPIRVVVHGALGKLGREVVNGLCLDPEAQLVGAVDLKATGGHLSLPDESGTVPISADLRDILSKCQADVLADFTIAKATMPAARLAAEKGINLVIATTGLSAGDRSELEGLAASNKIGIVMAPNFALGAVLMIHLSKIAARYMESAEIIEQHHHLKADAPSGTAILTAKEMVEARDKPFSRPLTGEQGSKSRGEEVDGVSVHAVRLPGLMAHQEVILGASGQTLTIRHDTINRECYLPGILLAIKEVVKRQGLTYGLDTLLGLRGDE